jgi:hypothetical protein
MYIFPYETSDCRSNDGNAAGTTDGRNLKYAKVGSTQKHDVHTFVTNFMKISHLLSNNIDVFR